MRSLWGAAGLVALSIGLVGCSGTPDDTVGENAIGGSNATNSAAIPHQAAVSPLAPAKDVAIERKDEALEFTYKWPAAAAGIEPLDLWLKGHSTDQYRKSRAEAETGQNLAKSDKYPFRQYSYSQIWETVADVPGALVMESTGYTYTGGAHGMPIVTSLIWDREAGKRLGIKDVIDRDKLGIALKSSFCRELDKQREEKRGAPVNPDSKEGISEFNQCPVMAEQEIIPVSRGKKALDTIRIVIGPYVAGPYAEGMYEISLPVTEGVMAAVKEPYRGWFSTGAP